MCLMVVSPVVKAADSDGPFAPTREPPQADGWRGVGHAQRLGAETSQRSEDKCARTCSSAPAIAQDRAPSKARTTLGKSMIAGRRSLQTCVFSDAPGRRDDAGRMETIGPNFDGCRDARARARQRLLEQRQIGDRGRFLAWRQRGDPDQEVAVSWSAAIELDALAGVHVAAGADGTLPAALREGGWIAIGV